MAATSKPCEAPVAEIAPRLATAVPRYTSYPTAPHFHAGITAERVAGWLSGLAAGEAVSLYIHIPYCDKLCWFCACHTKHTRRYEPVTEYLAALDGEIAAVSRLVGERVRVRALHLGGGSPTMLAPDDLRALGARLRGAFAFAPDAEVSIEIDPNDMDEGRLDAMADFGMTRASLGVQDFDPRVQDAINRHQSFALTRSVVEGLRARGVGSVNLDLLYGLPHQTEESLAATIDSALSLAPDRIALFGYAHVPWFKKHQTMIPEAALPGTEARYAQALLAARRIEAAGYAPIGMDHFALPGDRLAVAAREGRLARNFQGYTDDPCATLIGLGPSSISRFAEGYAQNVADIGNYQRAVAGRGLATARGIAFSEEDRARGWVIERLMCDFAFSAAEAARRFGATGRALVAEAERHLRDDGLLVRHGDRFVVTAAGRPLVRTVAARFDGYLAAGTARHSLAV
ncbi:oxygen-independent coproporphyrinogen III oxidase [Aquibium sp. A9E412]|uniref:oxygen-independent coproporphyrinogen III oxidase n=1 Tax=Aquibium sp. A9E412 TaxID=2976767 RepID=UPI0025B1E57B|nr:oxygen-independent coproporphyrinogen III oxidase [Aquibium sp. A9E412]MDN2567577.1 oxygen-independent coproporphyrinogen III oxidase [Aquibium sp. A9E412]